VPSGVARGGRRERTALGGSQGEAKMWVIRGLQASHDFWGGKIAVLTGRQ